MPDIFAFVRGMKEKNAPLEQILSYTLFFFCIYAKEIFCFAIMQRFKQFNSFKINAFISGMGNAFINIDAAESSKKEVQRDDKQ